MDEINEIKILRKKVKELEAKVSVQSQLIEILKSMPGCKKVANKDDKQLKKPISRKVKSKSRMLPDKLEKGQSKDIVRSP